MKIYILGLLALFSDVSRAFPEMVRHGYVHCTSCHVNLVGGGLLNEYGRALSREVLSQSTLGGKPVAEGDETFAYGLLKEPAHWTFGGDLRLLQYFSESNKASRARFLIMQVDLDALVEMTTKFRAFLSIGRVEPSQSHPDATDYVSSPRHGLEYSFTGPDAEERFAIRAGRFLPAFGIGFAEHAFVTRRELDLVPGNERYAVEMAWNNDRTSVIGTVLLSEILSEKAKTESGGILQWAQAIGEKSKVGVNYYESQLTLSQSRIDRKALGFFAHLTFDKNWFGLIEADRYLSKDKTWGFMDTAKLGYEVFQGLNLLAVHEYQTPNVDSGSNKFEAYSLGAEWFPRPHWDFLSLYRKERNSATSNQFTDVIWLVGHFYL